MMTVLCIELTLDNRRQCEGCLKRVSFPLEKLEARQRRVVEGLWFDWHGGGDIPYAK